jgi:DNA-binding protein YbaB
MDQRGGEHAMSEENRTHPMLEQLAVKASELEATAARLDRLSTAIAAISVTEHADDGSVRVTATSTGRVTAIELADSVRRLTPAAIAATVLRCVQRAQARIADQVAAATQDTLGDHPAGRDIVAEYRSRFPAVSPPPSASPDAPPAAPPAETDDIDVASMFQRR